MLRNYVPLWLVYILYVTKLVYTLYVTKVQQNVIDKRKLASSPKVSSQCNSQHCKTVVTSRFYLEEEINTQARKRATALDKVRKKGHGATES